MRLGSLDTPTFRITGCGYIDLYGFSCATVVVNSNTDCTLLSRFQTSDESGIDSTYCSDVSVLVAMAPGNDINVVGVSGCGPTYVSSSGISGSSL